MEPPFRALRVWKSVMPYDCMISRSLSTTCIFNFLDLCPVEVKTVPCILSPADGPLIVLKQTCRHWESRGCCSEPLGRQPEWKGRAPGDRRRINSTVQLRVTPLCVYNYVPQNTGQDPLIPPCLLSPICASVLQQRIICLCQPAPAETARGCARYEICVCGSAFCKDFERNAQWARIMTL